VENQHRQIKGYRELSEYEITLINASKDLADGIAGLVDTIKRDENGNGFDQRAVAIAKTELQTGFMWLVRAIARPDDAF
jgi:hypothetical protein